MISKHLKLRDLYLHQSQCIQTQFPRQLSPYSSWCWWSGTSSPRRPSEPYRKWGDNTSSCVPSSWARQRRSQLNFRKAVVCWAPGHRNLRSTKSGSPRRRRQTGSRLGRMSRTVAGTPLILFYLGKNRCCSWPPGSANKFNWSRWIRQTKCAGLGYVRSHRLLSSYWLAHLSDRPVQTQIPSKQKDLRNSLASWRIARLFTFYYLKRWDSRK